MQKKHLFFLVLGVPTFGEGGGVDLVGTKSQVFPKSSFEGSPYVCFSLSFPSHVCFSLLRPWRRQLQQQQQTDTVKGAGDRARHSTLETFLRGCPNTFSPPRNHTCVLLLTLHQQLNLRGNWIIWILLLGRCQNVAALENICHETIIFAPRLYFTEGCAVL